MLLLRAVNLGPNNRLAMADLRALLESLGHGDVKTFLNSGNATFVSPKRSAKKLAEEIEAALVERLGLSGRVVVLTKRAVAAALERLPTDLEGYVVVNVLFDRPSAPALRAFLDTDWFPEVACGNDHVLYLGFADAAKTKLTNAKIEKLLGVGCTARTPATLRKLLADSRPQG